MIVVIAAMDPSGLIGLDGKIPWHYSEDFKRFKTLTKGCTVIMGHNTWVSLPPKKLPGRFCVVLSDAPDCLGELPDAVDASKDLGKTLRELDCFPHKPLYVIGGAMVYRAALETGLVDEVDLTIVPEVPPLEAGVVTRFPTDLLVGYALQSEGTNPHDARLTHRRYVRNS